MKKGFKLIGGLVLTIGLLTGCSEMTSTESTMTQEEYKTEVDGYASELAALLGEFSDQNFEAASNPYVLQDSAWQTDVASTLYDMQEKINEVREMEDIPESMEEAHEYVLEGMDALQFVVDNYPEAIDTLDVELINQCSQKLIEGGEAIGDATEIMADAEGL